MVEAAVDDAATMTVGDPHDEATVLGPVISERHRARIEDMVERTRADGGVVATGGGRPTGLETGWYVDPTVVRDVDNAGYLAQHEVFGPVRRGHPPRRRRRRDRAVANATPFGLSGAVFTDDLDRALSFASRVDVGTFGVNGYTLDFSLPFGGRKQSGIGREFGTEGLAENTEVKAIALPPGSTIDA